MVMAIEIQDQWARADQIEQAYGLRPSYLRKLANQGRIQMRLIRDNPGAKKGVRLYYLPSIRKLLEDNE